LFNDETSRIHTVPIQSFQPQVNSSLDELQGAFQYVCRSRLRCGVRLVLCLLSAERQYLTHDSGHAYVLLLPCPSPTSVRSCSKTTKSSQKECSKSSCDRLRSGWDVDTGVVARHAMLVKYSTSHGCFVVTADYHLLQARSALVLIVGFQDTSVDSPYRMSVLYRSTLLRLHFTRPNASDIAFGFISPYFGISYPFQGFFYSVLRGKSRSWLLRLRRACSWRPRS
jgi:hypothetical protein